MRTPTSNARPSLAVPLDALNEMSQLKRLVHHSASPSAPWFQVDDERTVTLPALTHLDISDSARDCALAHLVLPALAWLGIAARSHDLLNRGDSDAQIIHQYIVRHAHSTKDTQPLQTVLIHDGRTRIGIGAWPVPDIGVDVFDPSAVLTATRPADRS